MIRGPASIVWLASAAGLVVSSAACSVGRGAPPSSAAGTSVLRITGSDTMVNLVQAWAENYKQTRPEAALQVAGGGSGVGISGLSDGTLDIAAARLEMKADEIQRVKRTAARGRRSSRSPWQSLKLNADMVMAAAS